jgi:hypothetical protein
MHTNSKKKIESEVVQKHVWKHEFDTGHQAMGETKHTYKNSARISWEAIIFETERKK